MLLRGWMTAVIELIEKADDSCGSIGMSFDEGFTAYLKIPPSNGRGSPMPCSSRTCSIS